MLLRFGLDRGENNTLNLSIQLSKSSSDSGSSSSSSENIVNSIECSSIESGLNLFNSYISRSINLSHCKVVVISEELASKGVSDYIYTLVNNVEMNNHASVIISKCSARQLLDTSEPVLEGLASRYYEIAVTSSSSTGYTEHVSLINFFSDCVDTISQPVAMLGSINSSDQSSINKDSSNLPQDSNDSVSKTGANSGNSYTAGETPFNSKENLELMGLCVFNNDKLVRRIKWFGNYLSYDCF